MTVITFKDIDLDRNGYLTQNEIDAAKQKGVKKPLYIGMTSADIANGVSKDAKLDNIYNEAEKLEIYGEIPAVLNGMHRVVNPSELSVEELQQEIKRVEDSILLTYAQESKTIAENKPNAFDKFVSNIVSLPQEHRYNKSVEKVKFTASKGKEYLTLLKQHLEMKQAGSAESKSKLDVKN